MGRREPSRNVRGADPHDSCATPAHPAVDLTPRERQIVKLVVEGCSNQQIAARLRIRPQTVKNQLSAIYAKSGVRNRLQLAVFALRRGLVDD